MLKVDFLKGDYARFATMFPERNKAAFKAALRSESFRLNQKIQEYAKSGGGGTWKFSPITKYLRKGRGYGDWVARFSRYFVDDEGLVGAAGFLGKDSTGWRPSTKRPGHMARNFKPISNRFVGAAARHSAGFFMVIGRHEQRGIAKRLTGSGSKALRGVKTARGMERKLVSLTGLMPRIGVRRVAARPFAGPVYRAERERTIRNVQALYLTKIAGGRYSKGWAAEWGNE